MNEKELNDLFVMGMNEKHCGDRDVGEALLDEWSREKKRKPIKDTLVVSLIVLAGFIFLVSTLMAIWGRS